MTGILYSLLAGAILAIQIVFNARVSEKAGLWLTSALMNGSGFLVSLILLCWIREGHAGKLLEVNRLYWLSGTLGVLIVYSVTKGVGALGPAYSITLLLAAQLFVAFLINSFGWFGVEPTPISWSKLAGVGILIAGVLVYQWK
ncbi:DMT family transporter [Paenibacillus durus]|uniref:Membrane protein n=1 Tax=Paenibacillus durus ATCC 35681 TaxID=1333534 RepID=A0A0F7CGX3_PAEDU|nr:DMT family transporter [Paenibacillus durus]AKG33886.1 membrane protein [Paenibacillus durus ATCC 35681]